MKVRANVTQLWLCKGDECSSLMPPHILNLLRIQYLRNSEYSVYMALLSQYALLVLKPSSRRTFRETVLLCFFPHDIFSALHVFCCLCKFCVFCIFCIFLVLVPGLLRKALWLLLGQCIISVSPLVWYGMPSSVVWYGY